MAGFLSHLLQTQPARACFHMSWLSSEHMLHVLLIVIQTMMLMTRSSGWYKVLDMQCNPMLFAAPCTFAQVYLDAASCSRL